MKRSVIIAVVLIASCFSSYAQGGKTSKLACYVAVDESHKNANALRFTVKGDVISGELKYIIDGEVPIEGKVNGTIKNNIIVADWTYTKEDKFYKIPVSFKVTENAVFQKPSAVNDKGEPYIPEDADFLYEFPKVDCSEYPERSKPVLQINRTY